MGGVCDRGSGVGDLLDPHRLLCYLFVISRQMSSTIHHCLAMLRLCFRKIICTKHVMYLAPNPTPSITNPTHPIPTQRPRRRRRRWKNFPDPPGPIPNASRDNISCGRIPSLRFLITLRQLIAYVAALVGDGSEGVQPWTWGELTWDMRGFSYRNIGQNIGPAWVRI